MGVKASKTGKYKDTKNGAKRIVRKQSEFNDDPETVVVRGGSVETLSCNLDGRRKSSASPKVDANNRKNSTSPNLDGHQKNSNIPKRVRTSSDGSTTATMRRTNSAKNGGRRPSFNPIVSHSSPKENCASPAISIGQLTPESALNDFNSVLRMGEGGVGAGLLKENNGANRSMAGDAKTLRQQSIGSVSTLCRSRPGSTTSSSRLPKVRNLEDDSRVFVDTLHTKVLTVSVIIPANFY